MSQLAAKKIVIFIGSLNMGGAEQRASNLALDLKQQGVDVEIITLFAGGIHWDRLQGKVSLQALFSQKPTSKFAKIWAYLTAPSRLRKQLQSNSSIVLYSFLEMSHIIAYFAVRNNKACRLVFAVCSAYSHGWTFWKMRLAEYVCGRLSRKVPLVIANSYAGQKVCQTVYHYRPQQFAVVHNGVDLHQYAPNAAERLAFRQGLKLDAETKLIGVCGRITAMKGLDVFITAAAKIVKSYPHAKFAIVGPDGGLQSALQAQARSLNIENSILWLGSRSDMAAVYNGLDVVCSSSLMEGTSNVLCEAMAVGKLCVATDVGDSAYIIGNPAFIVPPANAEALAETLLKTLNLSLEACLALQQANRQRAEQCFSQQRYVDHTLQLLLN